MSSLIPERPLVISPSLATTIGLEEAVLLQVLNDVIIIGAGTHLQGYQWFSIKISELNKLLPFWGASDFERISQSLVDKGVILINSAESGKTDLFTFAMNERSEPSSRTSKPITQPKTKIQSSGNSRGAQLLPDDWQPDHDLLQILKLNHNIPHDFSLRQLEDFVLYWRDRQQVSHAWPSKFRQHVLKQWRYHQGHQAKTANQEKQSEDITGEWHPNPDALEILLRTGVTEEFIEDSIPEFVLYWRERGEAHSTWNSKFIAHIRRQWAKFTKSMELDYEPREIAANWQPSEDVYDILNLANIDVNFARDLVAEFVLFWRDTKQIQRSWNTKFLQHAKYQWATRHKMGQHYEGQQLSAGTGKAERKSTFDLLTDRSWAKDLIEGS